MVAFGFSVVRKQNWVIKRPPPRHTKRKTGTQLRGLKMDDAAQQELCCSSKNNTVLQIALFKFTSLHHSDCYNGVSFLLKGTERDGLLFV